jgi:uncharacterized membrane protein
VLAVTTYEWFTTVHVLAVVMWVGGSVMLTLLGLMTLGLRDPVQLAQFAKQVSFLGGVYFPPLSLMVVAFGFAMIANGDLSYSLTWLQIGIVGWAVSFFVGAGYLGPHAKRLSKVLDDRGAEDAEAQALIERILFVARLDAVLLLFIVFDMTAKPWS